MRLLNRAEQDLDAIAKLMNRCYMARNVLEFRMSLNT
jgi:hypothetical protein